MFEVVRADKIKVEIREQMAEVFAEGFSQWLDYFSKDKSVIAQLECHVNYSLLQDKYNPNFH